jgi:formamidopyrimidine-DNA glycosylase
MVEGHSVHRIASRFRSSLVGKKFSATSPNGRFVEGAHAIDGKVLSRMEAVGKNLFAFFTSSIVDDGGSGSGSISGGCGEQQENDESLVVVHVHFGMSGMWAMFNTTTEEPDVKPTTRLRLEEIVSSSPAAAQICTHLSAMTVTHGDYSMYTSKKAALGEDPLRSDANPDRLFDKVIKSKKSIGQLIMDQSFFAGPGNIYRAEILFLAGVYPTTTGNDLDRPTFDKIWNVSVQLLRRGYDTGSILTVDANLDPDLAARGERRYIYNQSRCARCNGKVSSWNMSGRTCYACEGGGCQPKHILPSTPQRRNEVVTNARAEDVVIAVVTPKAEVVTSKGTVLQPTQHVPFISHCAPVNVSERLNEHGPEHLTIREIRTIIKQMSGVNALPSKSANKLIHVEALRNLMQKESLLSTTLASSHLPLPAISAEDAAREKAISGENRAVEHVAELSREQALKAISVAPSPAETKKRKKKGNKGGENYCDEGKKSKTCRRKLLDGNDDNK